MAVIRKISATSKKSRKIIVSFPRNQSGKVEIEIRPYKKTIVKNNNLLILEKFPKYDLGLIEGTFSRDEIYENER